MHPDLATDFYKTGHYFQYPPGTSLVYSNFTCRSDARANNLPDFDHKVVFFGLQAWLQYMLIDLWNKDFFQMPKAHVLRRYQNRMDKALGPGLVSTEHIGKLHDLGYMPLLIKALPEGSRVDIRVPLFTIRNTLPDFYWLTNYIETQISADIWKFITTATKAYEFKRLFIKYAKETSGNLEFTNWQGHDFSARGDSGMEDSTRVGAAHLTSFYGTDTVSSIDFLEDYYTDYSIALEQSDFTAGSVPATEHSVATMWAAIKERSDWSDYTEEEMTKRGEFEYFKNLITKVYPKGIVSIVADSYDFWRFLTVFTQQLKYVILNRDGKVVLRPDSGDPVKIIVGDPEAPVNSPQYKGAVEVLWDIFGGTTSNGFKTLDKHIGLIYGDSISLERAFHILEGLKRKGFAADNIVFGIGSYTYQYVTRDTYGCAIKATYGVVNGVGYELFKDPKTDDGTKKSAKGLIRVEYEDGKFVLYDRQTWEQEAQGLMEKVFENGKLVRFQSIQEIRQKLADSLLY